MAITQLVESGLRNHRIEFIRESVVGVPDTNPAWLAYSDAIRSFEITPTSTIGEQRSVGTPDVVNFYKGSEEHSAVIVYDLQKWFTTGGGTPQDASYDGTARNADNTLNATHHVVDREERSVGGVLSSGIRVYKVLEGAYIESVNISGEPDSGLPTTITINYSCEKIRTYQIDQPAASGTVTFVSDDAGDTMNITVEDEDAGTTETIALNGTTPVVTTSSFADVDAVRLASESTGDITVTMGGQDIMTIRGKTSYLGIEGDLGVPLLGGSGTHASAVGTAYVRFMGDTLTRGGVAMADFINSAEITISNNLEMFTRLDSVRKDIQVGDRTIELRATLYSEVTSVQQFIDHLTVTQSNIVWTMSGGSLTLTGAALTAPGAHRSEQGSAVAQMDNTFMGKGFTIAEA